jgi:hypothetical protein
MAGGGSLDWESANVRTLKDRWKAIYPSILAILAQPCELRLYRRLESPRGRRDRERHA